MPTRAMRIHELDAHRLRGRRRARSICSSARAPTSARSPTRSAATASRCAAPRSGRSPSRRPDEHARSLPLERGAARALRGRAAMRIAHAPAQLERQPRAVAIGTFDGVHRGHLSRPPGGDRLGARADGDHVRSASADRARQPRRADHDARAPPRAARGGRGRRRRSSPSFTPELMRLSPEEFAETLPDVRSAPRRSPRARTSASAPGGRATSRRSLDRSGSRSSTSSRSPDVSSTAIRDARARGRRSARPRAMLGRPYELDGIVVAGDQRGGTLGYPTANLALEPRPRSARATASTPARRSTTAPRSRSARTRTTAAPSGGSSRTCSTSTATSTASGSSSSCGSASATRRCSRPRRSSSRRSAATSRRRGPPCGRSSPGRRQTKQRLRRGPRPSGRPGRRVRRSRPARGGASHVCSGKSPTTWWSWTTPRRLPRLVEHDRVVDLEASCRPDRGRSSTRGTAARGRRRRRGRRGRCRPRTSRACSRGRRARRRPVACARRPCRGRRAGRPRSRGT